MSACLVQVLYYESQKHQKKKKMLECKDCPVKDNCEEKENEERVNN